MKKMYIRPECVFFEIDMESIAMTTSGPYDNSTIDAGGRGTFDAPRHRGGDWDSYLNN